MELDYKAIGKRIKIARIRKDLSQEELAEQTGFSNVHISNIESGSTKFSLTAVVKLANALDTSVDRFLCDNVFASHHIFVEEAQELLKDCDNYEIRIILDIMQATKETLRRDAALRHTGEF